ncbi:putative Zn-dependent protease [Ereboglobus sp. PH5-10]|uniref:M48 family metallopeptidase n=1 Tax=Ereboglobus sp. PH5-10 TaxID=2940629 RepID=UPI00240659DE|nr:M48 family metallopeptidase [Ereboglobus sp. PH5-10]MDF9827218.1 putative Zn-dependent protease [Ereboglobus sp. PH5-10]
MKTYLTLALSILLLGLVGCSTVSETGRRQLILPSVLQNENQTGLAAFADIKKSEKISTDSKATAQVQRVGNRIKDSVMKSHPMSDAEWEFVLFDSDQVNAFALPGGKVGVYTGLLKLVSSDDELAIVIGHEIAHVTSHHGSERASQTSLANVLSQVGSSALGYSELGDTAKKGIMLAYTGAAQGTLLKYSRDHETEADVIGMQFASGAGYNPQAAVTFWKKMAAQGGKSQSSGVSAMIEKWTSTHPPDAERIAKLESLVPKYMPVYEQAKLQYK